MHLGFLWLAGFRDLQWRRRRFVIAVLGSSLVFAITLMLAGFISSFDVEINRTTGLIGADGFVVPTGRPGPFTGTAPLPASAVDQVRALPGVKSANSIVLSLQVTDRTYRPDVYVVGAPPGGMGTPRKLAEGRAVRHNGEAVVDKSSKLNVGDHFNLSSQQFTVVGRTSGITVLGAHPAVFIGLADAQQGLFGSTEIVTAVAVRGAPKVVPPGLTYGNNDVARADLLRPQKQTIDSIKTFRLMLWVIAAAIIGSVVYLSALERLSDFAVFKAIGTATSDLLGSLMIQAVALSFGASVLAILVAHLLAPLMPVTVVFSARNELLTPVVGLVIGVIASGVALRRAVTVDPALAFGGH